MNAFPHNAEPETMTPQLFVAAVNMSRRIASSVSVPPPATLSQRDVPGLSRAAIPLLQSTGITGISVGVNGASLPPAVPRSFVWRDESSKEEVRHPFIYGERATRDRRASPPCRCWSCITPAATAASWLRMQCSRPTASRRSSRAAMPVPALKFCVTART